MHTNAEFEIAYDGEALRAHTMDVRDLAPALLAFGRLFDEANRVINGNKTAVRLQVKATSQASFDILFQLDQSLVTQLTGFLTGEIITSAVNLLGLLGFGVASVKVTQITLLSLIRRLRGQKPTRIKDLKNGSIQIEFDQEVFIVPIELLRLYQDIAVRKATEEILEPLKTEGIDTFKVINQEHVVVEVITKDELGYYELPPIEDEIILETEHEAAYSIISLAFKEDNKWRLYDGSSTISVMMEDKEFLDKVDHHLISFTKGDILICKVKKTQFQTGDGLKTNYLVTKVIEHKPAARQLLLFNRED